MPTTSSSSPRCVAFFSNLRSGCGGGGGGSAEPRPRRAPRGPVSPAEAAAGANPVMGCGRIDRVAAWVGSGVAAAFFASLDRCSCVRVATDDDRDDVRDAAAPLIYDDGNSLAGSERGPHPQLRRRKRGKGN